MFKYHMSRCKVESNDPSSEEMREILKDTKALFSHGPLLARTIQSLRPYICPFHQLLAVVPKDSSVLDVGCGSGIFLGLLMKKVGLRAGLGFDFSQSAIELASFMRENLPEHLAKNIRFERRNANQSWPSGIFDVVSMIDVMHHVSPTAQRAVFMQAIDHLAPGGLFLYKDMANRPASFALANRLHDLIMAQQWINYVPISLIRSWGIEAGLEIKQESKCHMIWYAHEWIVFKKPTTMIAQRIRG